MAIDFFFAFIHKTVLKLLQAFQNRRKNCERFYLKGRGGSGNLVATEREKKKLILHWNIKDLICKTEEEL